MNSERDTPRSRAARVNKRSCLGSRAIVVAFFLESATEVMLPFLTVTVNHQTPTGDHSPLVHSPGGLPIPGPIPTRGFGNASNFACCSGVSTSRMAV